MGKLFALYDQLPPICLQTVIGLCPYNHIAMPLDVIHSLLFSWCHRFFLLLRLANYFICVKIHVSNVI